ncbi:MAG: hypothetical protein EAX91_01860 [Candidatus Lokiarchaeota archaeon]|nr:hypothetical protein [Candidatus Lokiarchaeota archaeon]
MSKFLSKRITREYIQMNAGQPEKVFPLLCPVRESEWLPHFKAEIVYSSTGISEDGAIFQTFHGDVSITWIITKYNPNSLIEMIYVIPSIMVVSINIQLVNHDNKHTKTTIRYTKTGLTERGNAEVEKFTEESFNQQMKHWEKAINYYLINGTIISSNEHYLPPHN